MSQENSGKPVLRRAVTWKIGMFMVATGILDWTYLSGPAVSMVGKWAPLAWIITVGIMAISCFIYLEMALMFKDSAGGLAMYVMEGYKKRSPIPGAISEWGYVMGWGLAVAAIATFAGYFIQFFIPEFDIVLGAIAIVVACYVLNCRGIEASGKAQSLMVPLIITTVALLIGSFGKLPVLSPDFSVVDFNQPGANHLMTFLGACYLVAWSAFALECVLTLTAEYKDPVKDTKKAVAYSAILMMLMTVAICLAMTWYLPLDVVLNDPFTPLLPLAEAVFGSAFTKIFGVLLIIGLMNGVNMCYVASSRVLFESSKLGYMPKWFMKLNEKQAPSTSLLFIMLLNSGLIISAGESPVFMVVAGSIGYFITVILSNFSIYFMRKDFPDLPRPYRVPDYMVYVSILIGIINMIFLVVGSMSYGWKNVLTGILVLLLVFPLYWYRTKVEDPKEVAQKTAANADIQTD
ncbi:MULTISPECIES: APC family permease [unclassified Methanosarcina]|uniref:APC family permease n=1 Tax=unclassified Methanosarcina TaxID=2644672 RepID=UPI00064F18A1|nr:MULTISPECIES: APC family permease [unclassified Methanosarcina]